VQHLCINSNFITLRHWICNTKIYSKKKRKNYWHCSLEPQQILVVSDILCKRGPETSLSGSCFRLIFSGWARL